MARFVTFSANLAQFSVTSAADGDRDALPTAELGANIELLISEVQTDYQADTTRLRCQCGQNTVKLDKLATFVRSSHLVNKLWFIETSGLKESN